MSDESVTTTSSESLTNTSGESGEQTPPSRAHTVRHKWKRVRAPLILACVMSILFVLAMLGYANSGQSKVLEQSPPVADGVNVSADVVAIDPQKGTMTLSLTFYPVGSYRDAEDDTFAIPVRVTSRTQKQGWTYDFQNGDPSGNNFEIDLNLEGNAEDYPLDRYKFANPDPDHPKASVPAPLIETTLVPEGDEHPKPVPLGLADDVPVGLVGWAERWRMVTSGSKLNMQFITSRSGGVMGAVAVVVFLVLAMATLSAWVAWSVATARRPVEPTFASWFAAMLFALIPLQNYLPGAPPVGAWIHVGVFLWVEVILLTGMGVFIVSWFRFRGRPDYTELWAERAERKKEELDAAAAKAESRSNRP